MGTPRRNSGASRPRGAARTRRTQVEARVAAIALGAVLISLVSLWFLLPGSPTGRRSAEVVVLCLLLVAVSRRLLSGSAPQQADEPAWGRGARAAAAAGVAAAAVLPYLPSLWVGLLSDDFGMLITARAADGIGDALRARPLPMFLRPLPMLAWWFGDRLWYGSGVGYHALNLGIHAGNSLLVHFLVRRLLGSRYGGLAAGLLFALHPLHVEPVTWACCNSDLLVTFFSLLSLLLLEQHLASGAARWRRLALAGGLGSLGLALASKEAALALPAVAAVRVLLAGGQQRWRRAALVAGCYALVLAAYLGWRLAELGGLGGYRSQLGFPTLRGALLPSAPVGHLVAFLFPVNQELFSFHWAVQAAAVAMMAMGVVWWVRGSERVPTSQALFWLGFLWLMTTPVGALPAATPTLEHSRLAYLPTVGLAGLFGSIAAALGWRQSRGVVFATLAAAAGLTGCYLAPWLRARTMTEQVVGQAAALLTSLERRERGPAELYLERVPEAHRGAQVLRNGLHHAVRMRRGRPSLVHVVSLDGDVLPDTIARTELLPGQYVAAWQARESRFRVLRAASVSGASEGGRAP